MEVLDPDVAARVELLDLGCGSGRSLVSAERCFGIGGIGLDHDRAKVATAQRAGLPVFQADILDLRPADFPSVRFVTFDNVLEHLPDLDAVSAILGRALRLAADVVYVRHPSFEDVEHLASLGLKQYWTDWPEAHPTPLRLDDLVRIAADHGVERTTIQPVLRAVDSSDPTLLPLDAPPSQRRTRPGSVGAYAPDRHGPKPDVTFDRPVWFAYDILLVTGPEVPELRYRGYPESSAARPLVAFSDHHAPVRPTADRHRRRPPARGASSRAHAAGSVVRRSH